MSTSKSGETDGRYSEVCGANNRNGEPCKLPAGWGTPGSGGDRCKFHGGASTGPDSTDHLEGNDYAEGNDGGGAPELNTNAATHGACVDWEKAYERFDEETRAYVDALITDLRETAKEHAPDVPEERREQLLKEKATLSVLWDRAMYDTLDRGVVIEETTEVNGTEVTQESVNPTLPRQGVIEARKREIARELSLWPGYREE